jgi:hypothetical protein
MYGNGKAEKKVSKRKNTFKIRKEEGDGGD